MRADFDESGISTDYEGSETSEVRWGNITSIFILTTSAGPFTADYFWCFASKSEQLILSFPGEALGLEALMAELRSRFEGIDFGAFDVSQSTQENVFPLWGVLPEAE